MQSKKLGRDVNSIVLKCPNDQTISLRIISEKQSNAASGIQSILRIVSHIPW